MPRDRHRYIDGWRVGYRASSRRVPRHRRLREYRRESANREWQSYALPSCGEAQGRVIGFGHAGPADAEQSDNDAESSGAGRGEIHSFYLHPSAWGSGGAGALMSRCEEFLRDEGFTTAVLWVLRDNPRARAFYEECARAAQ